MSIHIYQTSGDAKPTDLVEGKRLKDTDTGKIYEFDGTAWNLVGIESGGTAVVDGQLTCKGYQQITSLTAATALTVPTGARLAMIVAETQDVRWRDDGTNPTASVGMPISTADAGYWYTGDLSAIKFIEQVAGAKLNVSYYS